MNKRRPFIPAPASAFTEIVPSSPENSPHSPKSGAHNTPRYSSKIKYIIVSSYSFEHICYSQHSLSQTGSKLSCTPQHTLLVVARYRWVALSNERFRILCNDPPTSNSLIVSALACSYGGAAVGAATGDFFDLSSLPQRKVPPLKDNDFHVA